MKICKNCVHFLKEKINDRVGSCNAINLGQEPSSYNDNNFDIIIFDPYDETLGSFVVSENFGCIKFKSDILEFA